MTRAMPRTNFNSSGLVRLLSELVSPSVAVSPQNFAERLADWMDVTDAITLSAALNAGPGAPQSVRAGAGLQDTFSRVRAALVDAITTDGVFKPGKVRIKLPTPISGADPDAAADFSPWHRYYQAHQRDMESTIGPLRAQIRAALSAQSPALRQIAALDAALGKVLSDRERSLLATVPALLEKRFAQLRQAHLAALADPPAVDDPARWILPGGWLATYCRDQQRVLLAELDLRLQPVVGLIAAFSNEVSTQQ